MDATQNGSGYINHPSKTAVATNAAQSITPNRIWSGGFSCISRANTIDTNAANSIIRKKWLVISRSLLFAPVGDVVGVERYQHVEQPSDNQERTAVLVGRRHDPPITELKNPSRKVRHPNSQVREGQ